MTLSHTKYLKCVYILVIEISRTRTFFHTVYWPLIFYGKSKQSGIMIYQHSKLNLHKKIWQLCRAGGLFKFSSSGGCISRLPSWIGKHFPALRVWFHKSKDKRKILPHLKWWCRRWLFDKVCMLYGLHFLFGTVFATSYFHFNRANSSFRIDQRVFGSI